MRPGRRNLWLLGVLSLLAMLALLLPTPEAQRTVPPLTALDLDEIQHLRIDADTPLRFERRDGIWMMTAPQQAPADASKLRALLRIGRAPSLRRFAAATTDLGELGLAPPLLSIQLGALRLEIGGTEPIHRRRYVRIGDTIHLIDDLFHHHLTAPASAFLAPSPADPSH